VFASLLPLEICKLQSVLQCLHYAMNGVDNSKIPCCRRTAAYQSNKDEGMVQRGKVPNFLFNNSTEGITQVSWQVSWMYNRIKIGELFLASL